MGDAEADKLSAMLTSIKLAQYYRTFIDKGYTSISACQVGRTSHLLVLFTIPDASSLCVGAVLR